MAFVAGCGGGSSAPQVDPQPRACSDALSAAIHAAGVEEARRAAPALEALLAAELAAQATLEPGSALAGRFRTEIARARRIRLSIRVDPLRSGTMSPTATVVPATRRAGTDARRLVEEFCAAI